MCEQQDPYSHNTHRQAHRAQQHVDGRAVRPSKRPLRVHNPRLHVAGRGRWGVCACCWADGGRWCWLGLCAVQVLEQQALGEVITVGLQVAVGCKDRFWVVGVWVVRRVGGRVDRLLGRLVGAGR